MDNPHKQRIERLRHEMTAAGIDCCIVFTADEHCSEYIDPYYGFREYLSGFTGSAGTLIVTKDEAGLWTDGRYFTQAKKELEGSCITLHRMGEPGVSDPKEYIEKLSEKADKNHTDFNIGTDLKLISSLAYQKLKKICKKTGRIIDADLAKRLWDDRPAKSSKPVYAMPDRLSGKAMSDKLSELRDRMAELNADCVIISDLSDVMWMFNIRGSDIEYNPVAEAYGYVDADAAFLFLHKGCCADELKASLLKEGVSVEYYDSFEGFIKRLEKLRILCDLGTLNAHVMELLASNELINRRSCDYIYKHIKNETECALAREWHIKDGLAVTRFIYSIKKLIKDENVKINEYEAAGMIDDMRRNIEGNLGLSFETISAYGSNGAIIHYSPQPEGSLDLKPKGFLLVDSGGQYEGATTDITRTIALGELTDEMKRDYTAVLKGVIDLADAVFLEGTRGENLDILARRPIWDRYVDYRHGTGHGIGAQLNVHEGPQAIRYKINKDMVQPPFAAGMITSDEPGIYLEDRYGIRIENELLCVEKNVNEWGRFLGFETLTKVPYEREAIVPEMLTKRQKELINEYHKTIRTLYSEHLSEEERSWLFEATAPI